MAYDDTKTWVDFERDMQNMARSVLEQVTRGEELYQDLVAYSARYGTNAQIATKLSVPVGYINDLQTALVALHRIYESANGIDVTVRSYFNDLRMFT